MFYNMFKTEKYTIFNPTTEIYNIFLTKKEEP